jgi:hypothetical protein
MMTVSGHPFWVADTSAQIMWFCVPAGQELQLSQSIERRGLW